MRKDSTKKFLMKENRFFGRMTSFSVWDFLNKNTQRTIGKKKEKRFEISCELIEFKNIFGTKATSLNLKNDFLIHRDRVKNVILKGQVSIEFNMIYCHNVYYMKERYVPERDSWEWERQNREWERQRNGSSDIQAKIENKIENPFLLGETEVTQKQYEFVMGYNPSEFQDTSKYPNAPKHPVENVTLFDCMVFCNKLSELDGLEPYYHVSVVSKPKNSIEKANWIRLGGNGYRLPYDDEWECAAKAGTNNSYSGFNSLDKFEEYAWFSNNSNESTQPVATKKPNEWGFYDMSGNVEEWVITHKGGWTNDGSYVGDLFVNGQSIESKVVDSRNKQIFAHRRLVDRFYRSKSIGFRIVRNF